MKIFKLLAVAFLGLSIVACSSDSDDSSRENPANGEKTYVTLKLTTGGITRAFNGEENPVGDEGKITNFEVFIFNSDGTIDTTVGESTLGAADGNGYLTKTPSETTFTTLISSGTDKQFIVTANTAIGAVANLAALDAKLSALQFAGNASTPYNTKTIPANGFEMAGYTKQTVANLQTATITVAISRLVSKVYAPKFSTTLPVGPFTDEELNQVWEGAGLDGATTNVSFAFTGYATCNGRDKSSVLFNGNADRLDTKGTQGVSIFMPNWDTWSNTGKATLKPAFDTNGDFEHNYSGLEGASWILTAAGVPHVYMYENKPDPHTTPGMFDPETAYCYIIEGKLSTAGQNDATRYWRVEIVDEYNNHVLRNCTYSVTVNKINTPGYGTPEDAWKRPPIVDGEKTAAEITVVVNKWRVFESSTGM